MDGFYHVAIWWEAGAVIFVKSECRFVVDSNRSDYVFRTIDDKLSLRSFVLRTETTDAPFLALCDFLGGKKLGTWLTGMSLFEYCWPVYHLFLVNRSHTPWLIGNFRLIVSHLNKFEIFKHAQHQRLTSKHWRPLSQRKQLPTDIMLFRHRDFLIQRFMQSKTRALSTTYPP